MNIRTRRRGGAEIQIHAETAEGAERLSFAGLGANSGHCDSGSSAVSGRILFLLRASASPRDPIYPQSIT